MLGFAVLMTGMSTMSGAVSPLRSNPAFINIMTSLNNPVLGTLFGIAFAALLQSASAAVGVLQALATTGAIGFGAAFPMILGIGVGASAPVLLAALGANKNGQRTSFLYLIVATIGMIMGLVGFYGLDTFFHFPFADMTMDPFAIAITNTAYRALTMTLMLPACGLLEKLVYRLIPEVQTDEEEKPEFDLLEDRFLSNPDVAYEQSMIVMNGMAKKARKNVDRSLMLIESYSSEGYKKVAELEQTLNKYEDKLGSYLMKLTSAGVSEEQGQVINKALQAISDFEKLSDYALNIADTAKMMHDAKLTFTLNAIDELTVVSTAVDEMVDITVSGFIENDVRNIKRVFPLKELIAMNCNEIKKRHVLRLRSGECHTQPGLALYDLLNDMLHIADHCASLALDIIKMDEKEFNLHRFLRRYQEETENEYSDLLHDYEVKYSIQL
ncbi:MAG TPA: Na/Pi cotransporter [Erysipelotrichaceae bacterium]|nr:Na/Pi cotransporter [Erysipelotrichaceae bacterium]